MLVYKKQCIKQESSPEALKEGTQVLPVMGAGCLCHCAWLLNILCITLSYYCNLWAYMSAYVPAGWLPVKQAHFYSCLHLPNASAPGCFIVLCVVSGHPRPALTCQWLIECLWYLKGRGKIFIYCFASCPGACQKSSFVSHAGFYSTKRKKDSPNKKVGENYGGFSLVVVGFGFLQRIMFILYSYVYGYILERRKFAFWFSGSHVLGAYQIKWCSGPSLSLCTWFI